jgi:hypothetical protein
MGRLCCAYPQTPTAYVVVFDRAAGGHSALGHSEPRNDEGRLGLPRAAFPHAD